LIQAGHEIGFVSGCNGQERSLGQGS
jgi:hypothetical protein